LRIDLGETHNRAMAKVFESWTVLKHGPLEKLSENLWRVDGTMPDPNVHRVMTIARMKDGRLLIHNAIALEEPLMVEIEAFGTPAIIVVPNGFHRQDAKIYKDRYPSAVVYAPKDATKKVGQVVPVTGEYRDAPKDDTVHLRYLEGCKGNEGFLEVKSEDGKTLVFNDVICNVPKRTGLFGFLLAPTGKPSVPRVSRWMILKDKSTFARHLSELATSDLCRVILSHGRMLSDKPAETLKTIAAEV
jgi:hypothetical protein